MKSFKEIKYFILNYNIFINKSHLNKNKLKIKKILRK